MFTRLSKIKPIMTKVRVVKVLNRVGACGKLTKCRLQVLEPPHNQIMRAVKGPVRPGQIIEIDVMETWNP